MRWIAITVSLLYCANADAVQTVKRDTQPALVPVKAKEKKKKPPIEEPLPASEPALVAPKPAAPTPLVAPGKKGEEPKVIYVPPPPPPKPVEQLIVVPGTADVERVKPPSNDRLQKAQTMRAFAWITAGLGVLGGAGAATMLILSGTRAQSLRADITAYNASSDRTQDQFNRLSSQRNQVVTFDTVAIASGAAGAAFLVTGIILFVAGEDPAKVPKASVSVSLSGQGGGFTFSTPF